MARALFLLAFALAGCANPYPSYELARSPAMISFCRSPHDSLAMTTNRAQAHCLTKRKNAQLMFNPASPIDRCPCPSPPCHPGVVDHFQCVP